VTRTVPILNPDGTPINAGELKIDKNYSFMWNGTGYVLVKKRKPRR